MKRRRRQRQRMLVLLGAVVLLAVVLIVIISSCSKKNQGAGITAQAFPTGSVLTLPVNADLNSGDYVSYGGYQFETGTKLSKMAKLITKNNENVTATSYDNAYGSAYLFTRDTGSGVESWCLYQKDPAHISKWYIFMGNHREVELPDGTFLQCILSDVSRFVAEREQREAELERLLKASEERYEIIRALGTVYQDISVIDLKAQR